MTQLDIVVTTTTIELNFLMKLSPPENPLGTSDPSLSFCSQHPGHLRQLIPIGQHGENGLETGVKANNPRRGRRVMKVIVCVLEKCSGYKNLPISTIRFRAVGLEF